jgi:ankyrin repeat protein
LLAETTDLDWGHRDAYGNTCVHYAAMFNHRAIIGWLWAICQCDIPVANSFRQSPLHIAAINGQPEIVAFCVRNGCAVNERDGHGMTPLHHAATRPNLRVVQCLIECGADPRIEDSAGCNAAAVAGHGRIHHVQGFLLACVPRGML